MREQIYKNNQGFTLIELMTVMAIIGILATTIIISLNIHKKRATLNKVLTEMSGVMENIYLCKSDDGEVLSPVGGHNVCNISSSYGSWPTLDSGFHYTGGTDFSSSNWKYGAVNPADNIAICCNSSLTKCIKKEDSASCS